MFSKIAKKRWAYSRVKTTGKLKDEIPVTKESPPAICIHTLDDSILPQNSIAYAMAIQAAGVPMGLHLYPKGGHGYGLQSKEPGLAHWGDRVIDWLTATGIPP